VIAAGVGEHGGSDCDFGLQRVLDGLAALIDSR